MLEADIACSTAHQRVTVPPQQFGLIFSQSYWWHLSVDEKKHGSAPSRLGNGVARNDWSCFQRSWDSVHASSVSKIRVPGKLAIQGFKTQTRNLTCGRPPNPDRKACHSSGRNGSLWSFGKVMQITRTTQKHTKLVTPRRHFHDRLKSTSSRSQVTSVTFFQVTCPKHLNKHCDRRPTTSWPSTIRKYNDRSQSEDTVRHTILFGGAYWADDSEIRTVSAVLSAFLWTSDFVLQPERGISEDPTHSVRFH